ALRNCGNERQQPSSAGPSLRQAAGELFNSPARAWAQATWSWRESRYRNYGSYGGEVAAMIYYGQREQDLRQAAKAASWAKMRLIPGITNAPVFPWGASSRIQGFANQRTGGGPGSGGGFFLRQRQGLAGR